MTEMTAHPLEIVPDGEAEAIERVTALQTAIMKARDPKKRGQHPKQQALLRGTFEIAERVPEKLRAGLFAAPGSYEALVRVSTGPVITEEGEFAECPPGTSFQKSSTDRGTVQWCQRSEGTRHGPWTR